MYAITELRNGVKYYLAIISNNRPAGWETEAWDKSNPDQLVGNFLPFATRTEASKAIQAFKMAEHKRAALKVSKVS